MFKTGKKPARPDAVLLKFGAYYRTTKLPDAPAVFGKPWLVPGLMLGNDQAGDCVIASGINGVMTSCAMTGKPMPTFTTATALADYGGAGAPDGYPAHDDGLDLAVGAAYRQNTGLVDAAGVRHKIGIYTALDVDRVRNGDYSEFMLAASMFFGIDVGVQLPPSAQQQFMDQTPWTIQLGEKGEDGHCIYFCGRNSLGLPYCRTWGGIQAARLSWLSACIDEGIVYVPIEAATPALLDDFKQVTS
jgi:hypothetical protein